MHLVYRKVSMFFISALMLVIPLAPLATVQAATTLSVKTTSTPSTATVGSPVSIAIQNQNTSGSSFTGLVDVEIYNASSQRVLQSFWDNQTIGANQTNIQTISWKPTTAGTYTIKQGIFTPGWSSVVSWNDAVGTITVTTAPAVQQANPTSPTISTQVDVWWPTANASVTGVQPFKALVTGRDINSYSMYWQVDGDRLNVMNNNFTGTPHKEVSVDLSGWNWKGSSPYVLNFVAKDANNQVIAQKQVSITIGNASVAASQPTTPAQTTSQQTTTQTTQTNSTPSTSGLFVDPANPARAQADQWASSRPTDAALMRKIADQPTSRWFGSWNGNITQDVQNYVGQAAAANATPVLVAYNIPQRDCGGYSAGGSSSPDGYKSWITSMANGIGNNKAIVVLEPDAISLTSCLSAGDTQTRYSLLSFAVNTFKSHPNVKVYIDAGHVNWISASDMANRLKQSGIDQADGFSLNVSNFYTTAENTTYGTQVSQLLGGKHFIVDTSRNGLGSNGEWCNPSGRALGNKPTLNTGNAIIDGFIWIKTPGESDGYGGGGPAAGQWWPDYALGLAQRASW